MSRLTLDCGGQKVEIECMNCALVLNQALGDPMLVIEDLDVCGECAEKIMSAFWGEQ